MLSESVKVPPRIAAVIVAMPVPKVARRGRIQRSVEAAGVDDLLDEHRLENRRGPTERKGVSFRRCIVLPPARTVTGNVAPRQGATWEQRGGRRSVSPDLVKPRINHTLKSCRTAHIVKVYDGRGEPREGTIPCLRIFGN